MIKVLLSFFFLLFYPEPLCVITEFAPYGDLLGFLRKKRGLKDAYYSIDQLPTKSLTSQRLMQFAWEIADGMAYLSSAKVCYKYMYHIESKFIFFLDTMWI